MAPQLAVEMKYCSVSSCQSPVRLARVSSQEFLVLRKFEATRREPGAHFRANSPTSRPSGRRLTASRAARRPAPKWAGNKSGRARRALESCETRACAEADADADETDERRVARMFEGIIYSLTSQVPLAARPESLARVGALAVGRRRRRRTTLDSLGGGRNEMIGANFRSPRFELLLVL